MPANLQNPPTFPPESAPFALFQGRRILRGQLWADVETIAAQLPDRPYQFNLCENRYLFCLCLLAAALRRQICLLPPSSQPGVIAEILADYPAAYLASEANLQLPGLDWFAVSAADRQQLSAAPDFDWQNPVLIAFTSGSTGKPKPCPHSLATFKRSAQMAVRSLDLDGRQRLMVSTTPPQHMYGLETALFWPLFSELLLYDARPFFAEDIRGAIAASPWPAVLASTPTHLRSLTAAATADWRNLCQVISATDTLSDKLASDIENALGAPVNEIYGSTETLSFASRQPVRQALWRPYHEACLRSDDRQQIWLHSPHLPVATALQDRFKLEDDGHFSGLGRHSDLVKISGKRTSLSELNRRLREIDGVEDGFFFMQHNQRLAAVVVSQLDKQAIRQALQPYIDAVFLPRKLHFVASLPRNATGKLIKSDVDALLSGFEAN